MLVLFAANLTLYVKKSIKCHQMQTKNGQNIKTNLFSRQLSVYGNEA